MEETWRAVNGWENIYEVSDKGNVRSLDRIITYQFRGKMAQQFRRGKVLKPTPNVESGYLMVAFTAPGGIRECLYVHILVAEAFLPTKTSNQEVCHRDGVRANCQVSNLRWGTRSENALDRHLHGTMNQAKGEAHYYHKLTNEEVTWVRENAGKMSQRAMAEILGVTHSTIGNVQRKTAWKHVI